MLRRANHYIDWMLNLGILALLASQMGLCPASGQTNQPPSHGKPAKRQDQKSKSAPPTVPTTYVLVGAGDIASCKDPEGSAATAALIEKIPGTVFAAGDLAYESGSPDEFESCYGKYWGRFKDRTRPVLGNHEYVNPTAHGYFDYWGAAAGPRGKGYYSFNLGNWHIVALNTNCEIPDLGGCGVDSPQDIWLREDLAAHATDCILAFGHHALYSSGVFKKHAIHPELRRLYEDLYDVHADVILAGHEHSYERFAPQDPQGNLDIEKGFRQIVVGTGGRSHDLLGFPIANSEVRNWITYGVIKFTLEPTKYSYEFIPEPGRSFTDSGAATCHNAPMPAPTKLPAVAHRELR